MVRNRMIAGGAVALALVAGAVGGAVLGVPSLSGAQSNTTTPQSNGDQSHQRPYMALVDAAAQALNLTPQQLHDKLADGTTTIADVAKQQNVDINTVIDAISTVDRSRISDMVNKPWPKLGDMGRRHGFGAMGRGRAHMLGAGLEAVANELNMSVSELRSQLQSGKTIADIAKANNVDVNKLIDDLVAKATDRINQAVTNKRLSQARADEITKNLKQRITDIVNNGLPHGMGRMGDGPPPGMPGADTPAPTS